MIKYLFLIVVITGIITSCGSAENGKTGDKNINNAVVKNASEKDSLERTIIKQNDSMACCIQPQNPAAMRVKKILGGN